MHIKYNNPNYIEIFKNKKKNKKIKNINIDKDKDKDKKIDKDINKTIDKDINKKHSLIWLIIDFLRFNYFTR